MMNPLYYASTVGWSQYQDFAYPGEDPRNQTSGEQYQNYSYPQQYVYPSQYPPQDYQHPRPGGHGGPAYQPAAQDYAHQGSNPSANEYNRETASVEEKKESTPPGGERNQKAHEYAVHYNKTLGGDYQYYYDYYMKTYANAPPASGSGDSQNPSSGK